MNAQRIKELLTELTIHDVQCVDANAHVDKWVNLNGQGPTRLISIKGVSPKDLTVAMLRAVLKHFKVASYCGGNKKAFCDLIVQHATTKQLVETLYPEIAAINGDNDGSTLPSAKKKKQAKSTKPAFVQKDGVCCTVFKMLFLTGNSQRCVKVGHSSISGSIGPP